MDKVKAIEVLKPLVESYVDHANITMKEEDDNIADALEMALEALKALDVPDTNVGNMISRQAAVELAMKYCPDDDGAVQCDGDIRELLDELENLPSAQPEPHWIPCSERLPEENGQYIITIKYKHVNNSYEDVYAEHGEWLDGKWDMFCFGHCGEVEDIIAWMTLPEPYTERRQDGDK